MPEVLGEVPTGWALPCSPFAGIELLVLGRFLHACQNAGHMCAVTVLIHERTGALLGKITMLNCGVEIVLPLELEMRVLARNPSVEHGPCDAFAHCSK